MNKEMSVEFKARVYEAYTLSDNISRIDMALQNNNWNYLRVTTQDAIEHLSNSLANFIEDDAERIIHNAMVNTLYRMEEVYSDIEMEIIAELDKNDNAIQESRNVGELVENKQSERRG